MPDNTIVALVVVIGVGIIDISIALAIFILNKAVHKASVADVIVGWGVFVILAISAIGLVGLLSALQV